MYIYLGWDIIFNMQLQQLQYINFSYTNIDYVLVYVYAKLRIWQDSFFSAYRFPIDYFNKIDQRKFSHRFLQKYYTYIIDSVVYFPDPSEKSGAELLRILKRKIDIL